MVALQLRERVLAVGALPVALGVRGMLAVWAFGLL
jgi:hypothetical protein